MVNRPLQGTLPREVRYTATLDFKVNAATVTNEEPDSSAQGP